MTYRTDALPLQSGPNVVRVNAVNQGGMGQSESYTLFYRRRTAFIRLTGLSAGKRRRRRTRRRTRAAGSPLQDRTWPRSGCMARWNGRTKPIQY